MSAKHFIFLLMIIVAGTSSGKGVRVENFSFNGVTNRYITPNGDGKNDSVTFLFSNPRDVAGSIKIYDSHGHDLITISINPGDISSSWDARVNGEIVPAGVYLYVLSVDDVVVSGSVVVIR